MRLPCAAAFVIGVALFAVGLGATGAVGTQCVLAAPDARDLQIVVIDALTGEPAGNRRFAVSLEGDVPDEIRAPNAVEAKTDHLGRIALFDRADASAVRVSALGVSARSVVDPSAAETAVFLAPPGFATLQVVDSDGRPRPDIGIAWTSYGFVREPIGRTAGRFGCAAVAVLSDMREAGVRIMVPFASPLRTALPSDWTGGAPVVRVRLPRTASIDVTVAGVPAGADVWVRDPDASDRPEVQAIGLRQAVVDGRARVDVVPPGRRLLLEVVPRDPVRPVWREMFTAPSAGEPALAFDAAPGAVRAAITGRLTDPGGAPLPDRHIAIDVDPVRRCGWDLWPQRPRQPVLTAADGTFRLDIDRAADELAGGSVRVEEHRPDPGSGGIRRFDLGSFAAVVPGPDGRIDLGDVRFRYRTIVVRVADGSGAAVGGARVTVLERRGAGWAWLPNGASTDAGGVCTLDRVPPGDDLRLAIRAPDRQPAVAPVPADDRRVDVVLELAARFEARVLLSTPWEAGELRAEVTGLPAPATSMGVSLPVRGVYALSPAPRTLVLDDLPAGRGTATVLWRGEVVWGPEMLEFVPGRTSGPGQPVDVDAVRRKVKVSVRLASGAPAGEATVWVRSDAKDSRWRSSRTADDGSVEVDALALPLTVAATDGGSRTGVATETDGVASVVLLPRRSRTIRFRIPVLPTAPGVKVSAEVAAGWGRLPALPGLRRSSAFDLDWRTVAADGTASIDVLQPGTYVVGVLLKCEGLRGGGSTDTLHSVSPATVTVDDAGNEVVDVALTLDSAELDAIVQRAARR